MKRVLVTCAALLAAVRLAAPACAQVDGQVIYGSDDRIDLYQTQSGILRSLADSTVALFHASSVEVKDGTAKLTTRPYGAGMGLCKDEPFYDQVSGAFCSGSLVAPDIIMTAGHCVTSQGACADTKFVFGFAVKEAGKMPLEVPANNVYGCKKLLGREQENGGADWALVQVDRKVADHKVLKLNLGGKIVDKTPLVVIGHPAGLPTKIAGGADVRDASKNGYFVANLDTYGGNSGSAVFNAKTALVEGILVRGENDYVYRNGCRVSNVCPTDGCHGEDVTKISAVSDKIPRAQHDALVSELEPRIADIVTRLKAETLP